MLSDQRKCLDQPEIYPLLSPLVDGTTPKWGRDQMPGSSLDSNSGSAEDLDLLRSNTNKILTSLVFILNVITNYSVSGVENECFQ